MTSQPQAHEYSIRFDCSEEGFDWFLDVIVEARLGTGEASHLVEVKELPSTSPFETLVPDPTYDGFMDRVNKDLAHRDAWLTSQGKDPSKMSHDHLMEAWKLAPPMPEDIGVKADPIRKPQSKVSTKPAPIGFVRARLIFREKIVRDFWTEMEEPSEDTCALAFDIFTRHGMLQKVHYQGPRAGNQIWGSEMNGGDILQVESVRVDTEHRRCGVATSMLNFMFNEVMARDKRFRFALSWPVHLNSNDDEKLPKEQMERLTDADTQAATALFRKCGYRRVGWSCWFARAVDPKHPSKSLGQDFDPPTQLNELHKLEDEMERFRTCAHWRALTIDYSDQFRGHKDAQVDRFLSLKGVAEADRTAELKLQAKFGCTCGKCLAGYISPRMKQTLSAHAEIIVDLMESEMAHLPTLKDGLKQEDVEFSICGSYWVHIENDAVMKNMLTNRNIRQGFCNLFKFVVEALGRNTAPTPQVLFDVYEHLGNEWPPVTRNYFERGGSIPPVIVGLIKTAIEQDEFTGDGEFMRDQHKSFVGLPECRNDHEFGFVRGMLLNTPQKPVEAWNMARLSGMMNRAMAMPNDGNEDDDYEDGGEDSDGDGDDDDDDEDDEDDEEDDEEEDDEEVGADGRGGTRAKHSREEGEDDANRMNKFAKV